MSEYVKKMQAAGVEFQRIVSIDVFSFAELLKKLRQEVKPVTVFTGNPDFDNLVGGFEPGRLYILSAPTKQGKCFKKGTEVLLWSGYTTKIEDVQVGDKLMGDDSKPRVVKHLGRGEEQMYKVTLKNGDTFTCNESHILTLRSTGNVTSSRYNGVVTSKRYSKGKVVSITVKDYLTKSKTFKHIYKMYKAGVDFRFKDLLVEPYFVGMWLGDGNTANSGITTADKEVRDYFYGYAKKLNWNIREVSQENNKAVTYHIKKQTRTGGSRANCLIKMMRKIGLIDSKFIPDDYKINTRENRLKLLAGLIDSDGYKNKHGVIFCNKNKKLCEDVIFVCRSLGLSASLKPFLNKEYNQIYYKVHISGNVWEIPLLLKRKYPERTAKTKDILNHSFEVEPAGIGNYYGVVLENNHLFLLADFTVVHNTTMAQTIMYNMATHNEASLMFSYEMGWQEIVKKFFDMDSSLGFTDTNLPIFLPLELHRGGGELQLQWLYEAIARAILENNIKLVVIDHLHFLLPLKDFNNISFLIGGIVREIKRMAVSLQIPIILITHVQKIKEKRIPDWTDIRDSSFITQEADVVMMMYRKVNRNAATRVTDDSIEEVYTKYAIFSLELDRIRGRSGKLELEHNGAMFIPTVINRVANYVPPTQ